MGLAGELYEYFGDFGEGRKVRASRIENGGLVPTGVAREESLEKLGAGLVPPTLGPRPVGV